MPRCCGSSPAGALPLHPSQAPPDTRPRRERLRRGLGAIAPAVCGRLPPLNHPELTTGLPTPQGRGQALMDNSYLVAAGLPPRRGSLAVSVAGAAPC